eukprot:g617.t1
MALKVSSSWKMFGGMVSQFTHQSRATNTPMRFSVFLPPQAQVKQVPCLFYLSGLTCTDDNFTQKGFAQRAAAQHGIIIVAPDTSPDHAGSGGLGLKGEGDSYDFGSGAGFYLNATKEPWAKNYRMYDYVAEELPELVKAEFPVHAADGFGITGHSMGGHGALTVGIKNPCVFSSISAFAPICNPTRCPWGQKAFAGYLGTDEAAWVDYDACELLRARGAWSSTQSILVDQGGADAFLVGDVDQLLPANLEAACAEVGQPLELRMQDGYDHSYFFMASFMDDHVAHHAEALGAGSGTA